MPTSSKGSHDISHRKHGRDLGTRRVRDAVLGRPREHTRIRATGARLSHNLGEVADPGGGRRAVVVVRKPGSGPGEPAHRPLVAAPGLHRRCSGRPRPYLAQGRHLGRLPHDHRSGSTAAARIGRPGRAYEPPAGPVRGGAAGGGLGPHHHRTAVQVYSLCPREGLLGRGQRDPRTAAVPAVPANAGRRNWIRPFRAVRLTRHDRGTIATPTFH